ncbi:winged helix-turn-helix domain-containing tetratricopeptide repeat protein [Tropicimonas sp. S265A]|uniref:winged helix-turn-helix domain-containing tetratricopeptide repeat protein n=1 Tax=Tropicimonas sp. S265A TaxID=3415134 RepID=UPI003C7C6ED5
MHMNSLFDPATGQVRRATGETVALRAQAADLLSYLVAHAGEVVPKDALMDAVWPDTAVTENSLYQCVTEIRKALGADGDKILQTIPRKGYRLVLPKADSEPATSSSRRWIWGGLAAACAALAISVWGLMPRAGAVADAPSIVILPFEAADGDARWTRIGRGLSAEIAGELARNDWLDVIAPHSAQTLAGQDAPAAADSFGVRFVMTGGVQVAGDSLRINAALHDAETDRVLWSERWQRPQAEIFDVQDEILTRIDASLGPIYSGVLARSTLDRAHQGATDNLSAFESFLLGVEQKHKFTAESFEAAVPHLERAVALDPDFAAAWATLSLLHTFRKWTRPAEEHAELATLASDAAKRGLAADPNDPTVNWRMAGYSAREVGDRVAARGYLRRAATLAPSDADVLLIFGWTSAIVGLHGPEPLARAEQALRLNPRAPAWYKVGHGLAAFASAEYRQSVDVLDSAPPAAESLFFKALAHVHLSEMAEAQRTRDALMAAFPNFLVQSFMGVVPPGDPSFEAVIVPAKALNIPIRPPEPIVSAAQ